MSENENSMPENLDQARQALENETPTQEPVVESQPDQEPVTRPTDDGEYYNMNDLSPEQLAEMYGLDDASQQIADELGESNVPQEDAARVSEGDTTEGPADGEETATAESTETTEGDNAEEVGNPNEPEKFVVDLKDAEEQGLVLSMKVDGEFKEFNMQEIQKYVGQPEAAEEKSRRAAEDRKGADEAIATLQSERERMQAEATVRQADARLAGIAAEMEAIKADIETAKEAGNRYEAQEKRDELNDKMNEYTSIYNGAQEIVSQQEAKWLDAQRVKLASSDYGKRFVEDADYRHEVAQTLAERNLNPQALKAIQMDADLAGIAIELHELKKGVTPKKRKQKPIAKVLRPSATSSKPAPKQTKLKERLESGSMSLSEIRDNPGLLGEI